LQGAIVSIACSSNQKEVIVGTSFGKIYRVLVYFLYFRATLENMLISDSHIGKV
jgi:hypothetical protein